MEKKECFICSSSLTDRFSKGLEYTIVCPRCGDYIITRLATSYFESSQFTPLQVANISGWLRENGMEIRTPKDIEYLSSLRTPTVAEKTEKLLVYISKEYSTPGQLFDINYEDPQLFGISWAQGQRELKYLVEEYLLNCKRFIIQHRPNASFPTYSISPDGWAYIESLKRLNPDSQIGFIAMWFDEKLDALRETIEGGVTDAGYEPKRIDKHEHINRIDDEIIAMIKRSKFIVADFTGQRGGVYFESGYALGLNLPVFWLCKKAELDEDKMHFDVRQYNFIAWEEKKLLEARKALRNRIESIVGRGKYTEGI